ncbi:hypothetical protein N9Y14_02015 [Alphaproteobacteria bacterium]|nr:hypothetical protein [Alphaproteobacteria bacterium]MDA8624599.1 hypothetical protein [Alphaproteobacteria bacterium]MDA8780551.1 hypothetical protein [Alphaproteobacteria bacterium]MDB2406307.1 hypothetical protein [Alphaproteobacteria bacterium]MDB2432233.1 hypothetical protein [Alphaproteobacteria bacterium]
MSESTHQPNPQAGPEMPSSGQPLSADARRLLAEMSGATEPQNDALDMAALTQNMADADAHADAAPVLLTPHDDVKARAFADLLEHIDDSDGTIVVDDAAALEVAEKYRSEKQAAHTTFDTDDLLEEFTPSSSDAAANEGAQDAVDGGDGQVALTDAEIDAVLGGDPFDEDGFGEDGFEKDEKPTGRFGGLLSRFRAGAGGVTRLIGVRNAAAAYDAQSGASLLPYTIIRAIILVLVAAVPPAVNLAIIQPQISDNGRKLTQIRSFEAQMAENRKLADSMAVRLSALEQDAKRRIDKLMPNRELESLFNRYVAALQKYDIELQGYNLSAIDDRKVIIGNRVQQANLVELNLQGRYDVYVDIRKIFVDELKIASVLKETMNPQTGSPNLNIKASLMVPTKRDYDAELDDPAKKAEEAKK